jgi:iron(III) transport system substrate-binding protein
MSRRLFGVVVAVTSLALVAACGGDNSGSKAASTTAETAAAPTAATTASPAPASTAGSAAGASTASTAAASADWNKVVAAAETEGKVTLYSVLVPPINDRLAQAFQQKYPRIKLDIVRVLADIDAKLDAEKQTGSDGGDIVTHVNYPWITKANKSGDLVAPVGPNATSPTWMGTKYVLDDRVQSSTFTNIGFAWNTNETQDPPKTFADLLKPEFANGKIGLPDPATAAVADFYAFLEDKYGADYLTKLAAQKPTIYSSAVPIEQAVSAGEIAVAAYATNPGITAAAASGAPVKFALPDQAWAPPIMTYIPKWSKRPNAAQVVYDFMSSPDGQAALGKGSFSPVSNVAVTYAPLDKVTLLNFDRVTQPGWYDAYYARWKKTFGR